MRSTVTKPYRRVLVKLSGEALAAPDGYWLYAQTLAALARDLAHAAKAGSQLAVVIGGGKFITVASMPIESAVAPSNQSTAQPPIRWACSPR